MQFVVPSEARNLLCECEVKNQVLHFVQDDKTGSAEPTPVAMLFLIFVVHHFVFGVDCPAIRLLGLILG